MKPISSVYVLILVPLLFSHLHETNAKGQIKNACESSLYKDLCISTLKADSSYKGAKLDDLAKIALKAATANATAIQKQISQMQMSESHTDLKKSLADCIENYESAVSQLQKSEEALVSKHYNDVNAWVTAAMSDLESCGDGLEEEGLKTSPILNMNTILSHLCSNVLAITNKLSASGSTPSSPSPSPPTSASTSPPTSASTSPPTSASTPTSSVTSTSSSRSSTAKPTSPPAPAADQGAKAGSASKWATLCDQAKTGIKALTENAMGIQKEVSGLLLVSQSQSGSNINNSLKDCKENYENAVFQLQKWDDALEAKRYNDVNQWVSAAMTDAQSCAESLAEEDVKSTICEKSTIFKQQCSNVLAVTNQSAAS